MKTRLSRGLAVLGLMPGLWLVVAEPTWSLLQLVGYVLLGGSVAVLLGRLGAFFVVTLGLAVQGSDVEAGSLLRTLLLPLWVVIAGGGVLACLVLRRPELGKRIEHGPLGPGGV